MAILATLSLAATLACGGTVVGCGSSSSSGSTTPDSGADTGSNNKDSGPVDTGTEDTGTLDTGVQDTGTVDTGSTIIEAAPQLGPVTFTPPTGATGVGSLSVTINPPSGFPATGLIFYTTNGTPPACTGNTTNCTGTGYVGPITISTVGTTTVWALAANNGDAPSNPVFATYTVTAPEAGALTTPVISPTSGQYNNDFLSSISADPGATICYRLDGTAPTCTNGTCTGGAETYNGASQIDITGAITDSAGDGKVTVTAISCDAAGGVSAEATDTFQLVVSPPTMINPVPGSLKWPTGQTGLTPTISTTTVTTNETVSIWYYSGAAGSTVATPTCILGTQIANPTTFNSSSASNPTVSTSTTINAIGCKQGYLPSSVVPFTYNLQYNAPTNPTVANPYFQATSFTAAAGGTPATPGSGFTDSANAGSAKEVLCVTTDGSTASCTAAGGCGGTGTSPSTVSIGNKTSANTQLSAIACGPGVTASAATAPSTYTLQYAQAFLASTDPLQPNLPGWGDTTGGTGLPITALTLPAGTKALPYPTGDGDAWALAQVEPLPACAKSEFGCAPATGALNAQADYFCWTVGTPATTPVCGATANTCAVNGGTAFVPTQTGHGSATEQYLTSTGAAGGVPIAATGVNVGQTFAIIGCQNPLATPSFEPVVYAPSAVTTIGPAGAPGGATEPQANPPGGAFTTQAVTTVTNNDANASLVCFTTDGTTPTCTKNAGNYTCTNATTGTTYCGVNGTGALPTTGAANCISTNAAALIPAGGTFVIPGVNSTTGAASAWSPLAGANQFLQASTAAGGTLNAIACNTTDGISSVYTPAPYTFSMAEPDFGVKPQTTPNACATLTTSCAGDNSLNASGNIAAGTSIYFSDTSNFDFNVTEAQGNPPAISIHWAWNGTPTCGTTAGTCPTGSTVCGSLTPLGEVNGASPGYGPNVKALAGTATVTNGSANITFSTAQTLAKGQVIEFGSQLTPGAPTFYTINAATTASQTATLSAAYSGTSNAATTALVPNQYFSFWSADNTGTIQNGAFTTVPVPATGTTVTLNAIACGETTNLQANSAVRSTTYTVQAAAPFLVTDQSCGVSSAAAQATAANPGGYCNGGVCPAGDVQAPTTAAETTALCGSTTGCNGYIDYTGGAAHLTGEQAYLNLNVNDLGCAPQTNWDRTIHFQIADVTPNSYICWKVGAVTNCNGTGGCTNGGTKVAEVVAGDGPITADQTIDGATNLQTGITVYAADCVTGLAEVDMTPQQFNLNTSPVALTDGTGTGGNGGNPVASGATLTCGNNNTVAGQPAAVTSFQFDQSEVAAVYEAGGPTPHECICYTTDGSTVNTTACAAAGSCAAASTGTTTCANIATTPPTLAGAGPVPNAVAKDNVSIDGPTNVAWDTCVWGASFNQLSGAPSFTVAPYTHEITVDGDTHEWFLVQNGGAVDEEAFGDTAGAGRGLFSYSSGASGDVYFGYVGNSLSFTTADDAIGILIGNGLAPGAPQTLPAPAAFPTTTLQVNEGAEYFITWATNATSATVYQWTAGSPGSWAVNAAITVSVKSGKNSISNANNVEFGIPLSQLTLLNAPTTNVTLQGIYAHGVGTGTPTTGFTWANSGHGADDGWFNDFLNSCVAPTFVDQAAPATVLNRNPNWQ